MAVMRWSGAGQEIMPYLPDLMNHLLSVLKTSTAVRPRELAISAIGAAGMWHLFLPSTNASSACPVHLGVRPSVLFEPLACGVFFFSSANASSACLVHLGVWPSALLEPLVCGVFFFPLPPNADSACPVHQLSGDGFQLQQPVKA